MATIVILFICFVIQISAFQVPPKSLKNNDLNLFRIPRAEQLRSYMNDSVDPCFDFYEFACGNWPAVRPPTEEDPLITPMNDLQSTVSNEIQQLLEEDILRSDGNYGRKIKDFYASCMNAETASQTVRNQFTAFTRRHSGMPAIDKEHWDEKSYNWLMQISSLRKFLGIDVLIGLTIKPDSQSRQDSRIYISEPSTLIPKGICKEADFKNPFFEELQTEITDNMAFWFDLDKSEGAQMANDLLEFEVTLCRGMSEEVGPDVFPNMTRMTLPEVNNKYRHIDFHYFVTTSLGQPIPQSVYLQHDAYFFYLSKLVRSRPKKTIANYIMYRALVAISFPEESDKNKRATLCVEKCMTHFSKVVGEMYNRKNFRTETVEDVEHLWGNLKEAFKTDINSLEWVEENARRQAVYKMVAMQLRFANYMKDVLNNEYGSLKIDKTKFWENIIALLELEQKNEVKKLYNSGGQKAQVGREVEAFDIDVGYNQNQNIVRMPLGLIQPPVYHQTAPYSYKFAILGFFIARQMINGVEEIGWNFDDATGERIWWDANSTQLYKERETCFREQYVGYSGENSGLSAVEVEEKIREIIADNGAVNIAFNAYLEWLQKTDDANILYDETLSEVDYTNTQLFFIAFAQNFCTAKFTKEEAIGFFPWDVPNYLDKFQVNGLLWNMKEFSREFNCLPGTEMNPGDKCVIY